MAQKMWTILSVLCMLIFSIPMALATVGEEPTTRQSGAETPLSISATITNHYAVTTVERIYTNPTNETLEVIM